MGISKTIVLASIAMVSLSGQAHAAAFGLACKTTHLSDQSFGLGLQQGHTGSRAAVQVHDINCFDLGLLNAKQVMAQTGDATTCASDFARGYKNGMTLLDESTVSSCYTNGYQAGVAVLEAAAREGNTSLVSDRCVAEYCRGRSDAKRSQAGSPVSSEPQAACYQAGYSDLEEVTVTACEAEGQ